MKRIIMIASVLLIAILAEAKDRYWLISYKGENDNRYVYGHTSLITGDTIFGHDEALHEIKKKSGRDLDFVITNVYEFRDSIDFNHYNNH